MQDTQREKTFSKRERTFIWLECRRPTGTEHSGGWNADNQEGYDIKVAGIQETQRIRKLICVE